MRRYRDTRFQPRNRKTRTVPTASAWISITSTPYEACAQRAARPARSSRFNTAGFETNPAKAPAQFNLRTFPTRVDGLHADGLNKWDGNTQRYVPVDRGADFQLRVDFINAMNHTQFSPPAADPLSTNFVEVTSSSATVTRLVLF